MINAQVFDLQCQNIIVLIIRKVEKSVLDFAIILQIFL